MQRLSSRWRRNGSRVAFVPTMGYLHPGHASLMRAARKHAGLKGKVVVSIYVNPTQFAPTEDLAKYPRDFARDKKLCASEGVDAIFTPSSADMYPPGFSTWVTEEALSKGMEGISRPRHFRGVTTVVAKLFLAVQPGVAVFGAKDFQQSAVVKRMVRDLNFPLKIVVAPTVREPDGLAMSSRNKYLSPVQRTQALVLSRAIKRARSLVARKTISSGRLAAQLTALIRLEPEARLDYISFCDPTTLEPVAKVTKGTQMALAVFIGKTRLIDNATL